MDEDGIRQKRLVDRLQALVVEESPSGDIAGLDGVARLMGEWLAAGPGMSTVREDTPAGPIIRGVRAGQGPPILVLGHMDTVWERGTLAIMPFRVADGRAFGPGVFDMKGGLALLAEAVGRPPRFGAPPLWVLLTPDEEVGSHASRSAIEEAAGRAGLALVLEAPGRGGALKVGRKGVGTFRLDIRGRAAHAGLEPERGVDAIVELAHQIAALKGLEDRAAGTTINVGRVGGGTRSNVVAEQAWAEVDIRIRTAEEQARVADALAELRPHLPDAALVWAGEWNRPPMVPTPAVMAHAAWADRVWQGLGHPPLETVEVGGASDGNFTAPWVPTLDGLGPLGDGAHARHEQVELGSLVHRAQLLEELLNRPWLGLDESSARGD